MDSPGNHLFSCPVFPDKKNRNLGWGDFGNDSINSVDRRALGFHEDVVRKVALLTVVSITVRHLRWHLNGTAAALPARPSAPFVGKQWTGQFGFTSLEAMRKVLKRQIPKTRRAEKGCGALQIPWPVPRVVGIGQFH